MRGIYSITCLVNGKVYVGQSSNLKHRMVGQKCALTSTKFNKRSVNKELYDDVQKYGWGKFEIAILLEAKDSDNLHDLEYEHMIALNSIAPHGYNRRVDHAGCMTTHSLTRKIMSSNTQGADNPNFGNHWSDQQKEFNSQIAKTNHAKGTVYTTESRRKAGEGVSRFWADPNNDSVKQAMAEKVRVKKTKYSFTKLTMDDVIVAEYPSLKDALDANPDHRWAGIYNACSGYRPHYKGFKWKKQLKI